MFDTHETPTTRKLRRRELRLYDKAQALKRNYGLSLEEADTLYSMGCYFCGKTDGKLTIDHNHKTGEVRGCLCNRCNVLLSGYEHFSQPNLKDRVEEYIHSRVVFVHS